MTLVENWWSIIKASAASKIGIILGALQIFYAYVNTSAPNIQTTLHFTAWSQWVPWVLGLATAFGVPIGRAVVQQSVTNLTKTGGSS